MVFMAACIGGLLLFGIGGTSLTPSAHDTILKVNGKNITQHSFDLIYNQMARQKTDQSDQQRQQTMNQALNEVIRGEVFFQEARKYGIDVTDQELQFQLSTIPAFQKEGKFDPQTYVQVLYQTFGISPQQFEKNHKKELAARKLNALIASSIHLTEADLNERRKMFMEKEEDSKARKEYASHPELLDQKIMEREINLVFGDWLNQLNSNLKVNIVSDRFQKMLATPAK